MKITSTFSVILKYEYFLNNISDSNDYLKTLLMVIFNLIVRVIKTKIKFSVKEEGHVLFAQWRQ